MEGQGNLWCAQVCIIGHKIKSWFSNAMVQSSSVWLVSEEIFV